MIRTNVPNRNRFHKPAPFRMQIANNALKHALSPKPNFFIERATIKNDCVVDVYFIDTAILESGNILESDWKRAEVTLLELEAFAVGHFKGYPLSQDCTIYSFIDENLPMVIKEFLDNSKNGEGVDNGN